MFQKDGFVFLDKCPVYPDKPSKLKPRFCGHVKIRYDQGLKEIINADQLINFNSGMLLEFKNWNAIRILIPRSGCRIISLLSRMQFEVGDDFEEDDMSEEFLPFVFQNPKLFLEITAQRNGSKDENLESTVDNTTWRTKNRVPRLNSRETALRMILD
jgi:hypothetical protein